MLFGDIDEGQLPVDEAIVSKHYSGILLEGKSHNYYAEIIALRRSGGLNHTSLKRIYAGDELMVAKIFLSHSVLTLEEKIKEGQTAKQALTDFYKS